MKKFAIIFILFLTVACARIPAPVVTVEPGPESTVIELTVTEAPSVELDWDRDPETLIIQLSSSGGGSAPTAALVNQLFVAQVWGDGRIIWVTWDDDFQRQVWQGQLSEAEMAALLQTFADKRFFRMKARYAPLANVIDGSTTRIRVKLLSTEKEVSEYVNGAPDEFHELIDLLTSGAGVEAAPYFPQTGQLTAREIDTKEWMENAELPIWDATALGLDLHEAGSVWIEGEALLKAWEVVNQNSAFPIVAQGDGYFELHLRLPEVGVMAPR